MLKAVIDAGEREKLELSRNLHDQVIPLLAISKLQIEAHELPPTAENQEYQEELTRILARAIQEIRGISHNSSPILFKEYGLKKSILNFIEQLNTGHLNTEVQFNYPDEINMDEDVELSIYRILLELMNNSLKYAKCKNIQIDAGINTKGDVLIKYQDDGIGTETIKLGQGLLSIKSRVTLLNGDIQFQSSMNEGFIVLIKLPSKLLI